MERQTLTVHIVQFYFFLTYSTSLNAFSSTGSMYICVLYDLFLNLKSPATFQFPFFSGLLNYSHTPFSPDIFNFGFEHYFACTHGFSFFIYLLVMIYERKLKIVIPRLGLLYYYWILRPIKG